MIGYVILIVIAVSLSIAVYAFLKLYLPKDVPKCPDDISVSIEYAVCKNQIVNIYMRNRGLFNVNGVFVRAGDPDRIYRELLSQEIFPSLGGILKPGEEYNVSYNYVYTPTDIKEFEIQPFVFVKKESAICERAVVKKEVSCS